MANLCSKVPRFSQHNVWLSMSIIGIFVVVNEAAIHAASLSKDKVDRQSLEAALERVIAGPEKRTNVLSPAEKEVRSD